MAPFHFLRNSRYKKLRPVILRRCVSVWRPELLHPPPIGGSGGPRAQALCSGQLRSVHIMLFVMRNLNRGQQWGMTGMYFHWREPRKGGGKKKRNQKKHWGKPASRRSAHSGQSGRLMLLYIGCHSASPPPTPFAIGWWSPYQFLSLSASPRRCLLRWTVTQF